MAACIGQMPGPQDPFPSSSSYSSSSALFAKQRQSKMPAICNFDWTGAPLTIMERKVKIDEQLTEVFDDRLGLRHVLTRAHHTLPASPFC